MGKPSATLHLLWSLPPSGRHSIGRRLRDAAVGRADPYGRGPLSQVSCVQDAPGAHTCPVACHCPNRALPAAGLGAELFAQMSFFVASLHQPPEFQAGYISQACDRVTERERDLLAYSYKSYYNQGWTRLKPRTRNSTQLCHTGGRDPSAWASRCCFQGPLAASCAGNRAIRTQSSTQVWDAAAPMCRTTTPALGQQEEVLSLLIQMQRTVG